MFQQILKNIFRRAGVDVRRLKNVPAITFLGLRGVPVNCVLDVGANVGQFARYARKMFPASRIHCFEPLPSAAAKLREWAQSNADMGVRVHEVALGDQIGTAEIIEHLDHSPSSSFLKNTRVADEQFPQTVRQMARKVEVDTLDDWLDKQKMVLDSGTLLKLDVQGFECQVLRGGCKAIAKVGLCMVEVTPIPLYEAQSKFADIVALLAEAGLEYFGNLEQFHYENGLPMYMDMIFVRQSLLGENAVSRR